ncbi:MULTISPECIES: hypothetical protein [Ralstonia solanacearum species complex]|uniref:Hypothetical transmembrane protein n=1 Tax=Ralstonia solanacearum IPO1609 TaxID=564066 RepID=A0ABF7REQ6_RALSL|nr:hypothetical protein [Ralstonia solanacearum]ALF87435.1 hypothetical protein RSUY_10630 [Ralstonia solanacearum]ATI26960.1 hypothetical protein CCY86_05315 [Ralstonia solanacearum]ATJ85728.1 hypothetical protein CDC59_05275 [Ralstonia solanacearum]KEI32993.1 hypothetical protein CQ06_12800 [Ralstonia solanacearum]KFX30681.1 hypothetical protein KR96_00605 [Ralstonia solanacearum]
MRFALKTVAVVLLAFAYTRAIYLWSWLDPFFASSAWQRIYGFLAHLFGVSGAEQGEDLQLAMFLVVALLLAILSVWLFDRYVCRPACHTLARQRTAKRP